MYNNVQANQCGMIRRRYSEPRRYHVVKYRHCALYNYVTVRSLSKGALLITRNAEMTFLSVYVAIAFHSEYPAVLGFIPNKPLLLLKEGEKPKICGSVEDTLTLNYYNSKCSTIKDRYSVESLLSYYNSTKIDFCLSSQYLKNVI